MSNSTFIYRWLPFELKLCSSISHVLEMLTTYHSLASMQNRLLPPFLTSVATLILILLLSELYYYRSKWFSYLACRRIILRMLFERFFANFCKLCATTPFRRCVGTTSMDCSTMTCALWCDLCFDFFATSSCTYDYTCAFRYIRVFGLMRKCHGVSQRRKCHMTPVFSHTFNH